MFKKTIASAFLVFFSSIGILMGDDKIIKGKDEDKTPENKWYDTVNLSGYVDVYYNYTMNNRQGGTQDTAGTFHTYNKQFAVNAVKLSIEKVPDKVSPWGFRMDLQNGQNLMYQERPYQTTNSIHNMQLLQQGYISMYFPIGKGLLVDVGKMATHIGNEVLDSKDNMSYTIGYIFFNTIPFIHTGARATYTITDKWSAGLYLYNSAMGTGFTGGSGSVGQQFGAQGLLPYGDPALTSATSTAYPAASLTSTAQHAYVDGPNPLKTVGTQVKGEVTNKISWVWNTLYGDDNLRARPTDLDTYAQTYYNSYGSTALGTPGYTIPNRPSSFRQDNWFINHMSFIFTPMSKLTVLLDWTFGQRKGETINGAYGWLLGDNKLLGLDLNNDGTKDIFQRGDRRDTIKIYNTYGIWMKYEFTSKFATALRYENIDDSRYGGALVVNAPLFDLTPRDRYDLQVKDALGLRSASSLGQIRTLTITPTYSYTENLLIKIDLRRDWGLGNAFIDQNGKAAHGQNGIIIGIVAKF
jgi:hypothetical protein